MKSILIKDLTHCLTLIVFKETKIHIFSTIYKPQLNKVKGSKIRMYLCTLYFLFRLCTSTYVRVCSRRKSATSSKGVRFPIFLVLKLHVSMRTNKKHDPPSGRYLIHTYSLATRDRYILLAFIPFSIDILPILLRLVLLICS